MMKLPEDFHLETTGIRIVSLRNVNQLIVCSAISVARPVFSPTTERELQTIQLKDSNLT